MIVRNPLLQDVRATISAGTAPVTIQPRAMDGFPVRMWRVYRVPDQKSDLATAANSIRIRHDEVAVRAAELENRFNTVVECPALFSKEIPRKLPPLRKINHKFNIITASSCIQRY